MNLLLYGVGSKKDLMQDFLIKHVYPEWPSVFVRGYHSGLTPKSILQEIVNYINESIDFRP